MGTSWSGWRQGSPDAERHQGIGLSIVLSDRRNFWLLHGRWFLASTICAALATAWYLWDARLATRWPGGGSRTGLAFGTIAGLIFLFECGLAVKKSRWGRTRRWLGSAQSWMKAHLWLGLLTAPLVVMHSGFRWGGPFTTFFLLVYAVVMASGLLGLALQTLVPRMMLEHLRDETVFAQIPAVVRQLVAEADQLVGRFADAGAVAEIHHPAAADSQGVTNSSQPIVVGALRKAGRVGKSRTDARPTDFSIAVATPDRAPILVEAYRRQIRPYLCGETQGPCTLRSPDRSLSFFAALKQNNAASAASTVEQLEQLCQRRRDYDLQAKLHWVLHGWLMVHLPVSMILLVLLGIHVLYALRYG
jgi:hypothetical protein